MVVAHCLVCESEDGSVVGDLRPWVLTLAEQVVQTLLEGREDVSFGLAQLICSGFQGLHVTLSQRRSIPAAPMIPRAFRKLGGSEAPSVPVAFRSGGQPYGALSRYVPGLGAVR